MKFEDNYSCDGCFNDQRSINDKLNQTIKEAQKYAKEKQKIVVVYPIPGDFAFAEEEKHVGFYTSRVSPDD